MLTMLLSHGEGWAEFRDAEHLAAAKELMILRYVENNGSVASCYPANPNSWPVGFAGLTSADGTITITTPHSERVIRALQNTWHPDEWDEGGHWLRLFRNAMVWAGDQDQSIKFIR